MKNKRGFTSDNLTQNNTDSLRIVGTEESLKKWEWLFQILQEDGTIEIVSRPDRIYEMRGSELVRQYWEIRTKF
jgi:hypothetical protein